MPTLPQPKIVTISYRRVASTPNYGSQGIEVSGAVGPGEDPDDVLEALAIWVHDRLDIPHRPGAETYRAKPAPPAPAPMRPLPPPQPVRPIAPPPGRPAAPPAPTRPAPPPQRQAPPQRGPGNFGTYRR